MGCWDLVPRRAAAAVAVIGLAGAGGPAAAAGFRADFRGVPVDPARLRVVGVDHGCRVEPGPDGLRVTIPSGSVQGGQVGVELVPRLSGDFTVEAGYRLRRVGPPRGGYG